VVLSSIVGIDCGVFLKLMMESIISICRERQRMAHSHCCDCGSLIFLQTLVWWTLLLPRQ